MRDATGTRTLDFLVIGAQKGGTTSLWRYLRSHPRIRFPLDKEAPFFTRPYGDDVEALARVVAEDFRDAPPDALLGTVTPQYMMGNTRQSTEQIAARIGAALPEVRIVALLRDPIERAISHYRMSVRRGWEARPFDEVAQSLLEPAAAAAARASPTETSSYFAQGEYGRILHGYRLHVPAERTLVALTEQLAADPGRVVDQVLGFLGLPPGHRPDDLGTSYHRGGVRRRIDAAAERELTGFLGEAIWPELPEGHPGPRAFGFFLETWNILPDDEPTPVSPEVRARLEEHYAADAELLAELGVPAPWLKAWRDSPSSSARATRADATDATDATAAEELELRRALTDAQDRLLRRGEDLDEAYAQIHRMHARGRELERDVAAARADAASVHEQLTAAHDLVARRDEEIVRLRTRIDRIVQSRPYRLYARLQQLPGARSITRRRAAGYAAEVERRSEQR